MPEAGQRRERRLPSSRHDARLRWASGDAGGTELREESGLSAKASTTYLNWFELYGKKYIDKKII